MEGKYMGNSEFKIMHYRIGYQNSNVAIIKFDKNEISVFLENSLLWIENGECEDIKCFWNSFEEALMEIHGVDCVLVDGYEITIVKDPILPNWGKIIENVIWCSLFFINPGGGAIKVSANGNNNVGKLITHSFNAIEPNPSSKK